MGNPKLECPADVIPRLGKVSDRQIARDYGYHPETVQTWRRERGIEPWQQPKKEHRVTACAFCQRPFVVVGGQASRLRTTCPAPRKCQYQQAHKTRRRQGSKTNMKQLQGLMERHMLRDKD